MSPGSAWLSQSPDVSASEGDTVSLVCCWSLEARRFLVTWLRNGNALRVVQKVNPSGPLGTSDCMNLTLADVLQEMSGNYSCRVLVEVPSYSVLEGHGTVLTVEGPGHPGAAGEELEGRREVPGRFLHWFLRSVFLADAVPRASVPAQALGLVLRSLPVLALVLAFFCIRGVRTHRDRKQKTGSV